MCYGDLLPTVSSESVAEREWRAPAAQGSPNMLHDRYYDAARAAEERSLAMASVSLKVRAIHLDLAARYDARVEANTTAGLPPSPSTRVKRSQSAPEEGLVDDFG